VSVVNVWRAAAIASLLGLALAPTASGSSWGVKRTVGDLRLAGARTLWTAERSDGGFDLYEARSGKARRLRSFRPHVPNSAEFVSLGPELAANGTTTWLEITKLVVEKDPQASSTRPTSRLLTGSAGGPLTEFSRCDHPTFPLRGGLDASDALLALGRCDGTVEIRDLTGATHPTVTGSNVDGIRVAGRYVAWHEGPPPGDDHPAPEAIVVYDTVKGAELYRIPAAEAPPRIYSFALDNDGTTVFGFDPDPNDTRSDTRVGWASPGEPSFHRLGLRATAGYTVKLVDGRLLLIRSLQRSGVSRRTELMAGSLRGPKRVLARDTAGFSFDFDGRRVLYVKRTCHGRRVTRRSVSSFHKAAEPPRCVLRR
jgi:hypothetical protein